MKLSKYIKSVIGKIHSTKELKGKIVAVEPGTGKWFAGNSPLEAIEKGEELFPDSIFYIIRAGYKAAGMMKKIRKCKKGL